MVEEWVKRLIVQFTIFPIVFFPVFPPPNASIRLKINRCPQNCPMLRDKGCISSICILQYPYQKLEDPIKEGELPKE